MNFSSSNAASETRRPLILGLLGTASVLAAWMAWRAVSGTGGSLAGCGPAGGCSSLLSSPYSRLWGLPVGAFGLVLYLGAAAAVVLRAGLAARLAALAILAGAAWFAIVQAVILREWCPWCCLTHLLACAAAVLMLTGFRNQGLFFRRKQAFSNGLMVLIFGTLLAGAQIQDVKRTEGHTRTGSVISKGDLLTVNEKEELSLFGDRLTVDPKTVPVLGQRGFLSPAQAVQNPLMGLMAPQPVILLSDWTCSHCRALLATLIAGKMSRPEGGGAAGAAARAGTVSSVQAALESASVVVLPAWREEEGRALHSLMLHAWLASESDFLTLAGELASGRLAASPSEVEPRIRDLVGGQRWELSRQANAARVEEILKTGAAVLRESDALLTEAVLPRLISVNGILSGEPSEESLAGFLRSGGEALASQVEDVRKLAEPNQSRIEFESTAVETPEAAEGATVTAEFRFTNTGTEPLNLVAVRTTCSCTVPEGWKQTVPPGGKGAFAVHIDTAGHKGRMSRQINLVVNASNAPTGGAIPLRVTVPIRPAASPVTQSGAGAVADPAVHASPPRRQVH